MSTALTPLRNQEEEESEISSPNPFFQRDEQIAELQCTGERMDRR
jgi:hypothetical protein